MATLDRTTFEGKYNSGSVGLFKDNTTNDIEATDLRSLVEDIADSFGNLEDDGIFVDKEVPTGSINSSNVTFTLSNTPVSGSEHVYLNGLLQEDGGGDYTLSGLTITFVVAPDTGDKLVVSYRR
jgi:hypothetical protein